MHTTIIAEGGINHNGSLELCKKLIDASVFAGANIFKLQKRTINKCYSQEYLNQPRNDNNPFGWKTQREQKEGLEFSKEEYDIIVNYCKQKGIDFMASAWDLESVEFLKQYDLKFNKIASAMLTYKELLISIAKQNKPTRSTFLLILLMIKHLLKLIQKQKILI